MGIRVSSLALGLLAGLAGPAAEAGEPVTIADLERGWAALRTMDCGRCHGRDLNGWAAPSLIAAVRDAPRERFNRVVLEGDIGRGMPGYKNNSAVVRDLGAMFAYLKARGDGAIAKGKPAKQSQ